MSTITQQQLDIAEAEALNMSGLTKDKVTTDLDDTKYYDGTRYLIYCSVKQGIINAFTKY
jgi:hypothetical protein